MGFPPPPLAAAAKIPRTERFPSTPQATARFDAGNFANEWDGVVAFVGPGEEQCTFDAMRRRAAPTELSWKRYPQALQLAAEKFPTLSWDEVSSMSTVRYREKWMEAMNVVNTGNIPAIRNIDTVIGEVMQGRQDTSLAKTAEGYEVFRNNRWDMNVTYDDMCLEFKGELAKTFGRPGFSTLRNEDYWKPPPQPFQQDAFIKKIAECVLKYLAVAKQDELDSNMWGRLLFADNWLYDYTTGETRLQRAADRLFRHTARNMPFFDAPDTLKHAIEKFTEDLCEFFRQGGSDLSPVTSEDQRNFTEAPTLKQLRKDLHKAWFDILGHPCSKELRALANVLCKDHTDLNDIIWVKRQDSRILATMRELIGMNVFVGPQNTGKSFINMRIVNFLGDGQNFLATQKKGKYLCSALRDDAESSNPVTASLAGKKYVSFKEIPALPLQPETIKNLMDGNDGMVDARHNHSKPTDRTSFPVTMVLGGCKNSCVSLATTGSADTGCANKISELSCDFEMVADPDANNPRQHLADVTVPTLSASGAYDGEYFFWSQAMFKTLAPDICKTRHMWPVPPSIAVNFQAQETDTRSLADKLMAWFDEHTIRCTAAEASEVKVVKPAAVLALGPLDGTVFSACGKAQSNGQKRIRTGTRDYWTYTHRFLNEAGGRDAPVPCKLK